MAGKTQGKERLRDWTVTKISRRVGDSGVFDIEVDGPDGEMSISGVRRKAIAMFADAYRGRTEPQCMAAHRLYGWLVKQFPSLPPKLTELQEFSGKVDFSLPKPKPNETEKEQSERAWAALFGESGIVYEFDVTAGISIPPKDVRRAE